MTGQQIELETKIAFLEQHINELSDVVYQQQKQIDALHSDAGALKNQFKTLLDGGGDSDAIEKPPHY